MNDPSMAGRALPTTIPQYLAQLRAALFDALADGFHLVVGGRGGCARRGR